MYVNKPVISLSLSLKRKKTKLSETLKRKQPVILRSSNLTDEKKDNSIQREMEMIQILFHLQKKVEEQAAVISTALTLLEDTKLTETEEYKICQKIELIDKDIKRIIRTDNQIFRANQDKKSFLSSQIQLTKQLILHQQQKMIQIRNQNEQNLNKIQQMKQQTKTLQQLQQQIVIWTNQKIKIKQNYHSSQQKCQNLKQNVFDLQNLIFEKQLQIDQQQQSTKAYQANLNYAQKKVLLQNYMKKVKSDYKSNEKDFKIWMTKKITEAVSLRLNILKIDEVLKQYEIQLNKQRKYLKKYNPFYMQELQTKQIQKNLFEEYQNIHISPPQSNKWQIKNSRTLAHNDVVRKEAKSSSQELDIRKHYSLHHSAELHKKIKFKKNIVKTQSLNSSNHIRQNDDQMPTTQSLNYAYKDTKTKRQVDILKNAKNKLQLESLYQRKSDSIKKRIITQLENKGRKKCLDFSQYITSQKKKLKKLHSQIELISIENSEDDSRFDYVEVQLMKEDMEIPA